jgi:hypothetical protein
MYFNSMQLPNMSDKGEKEHNQSQQKAFGWQGVQIELI